MAQKLQIKFDRIYRNSIGYNLLKAYVSFPHNLIHYRKIHVVNKEKLPLNQPVILTPNHQNALMDALAINHQLKGFNVFMARSDIFKQTAVAIILRFIKIMPIYRIRDGASNLQNNEAIFENAVKALRYNRRLAMFAEGTHSRFRRLRPLKKGVARIAFQAAERMDYEANIRIVPVGLDYSNFQNFRQVLVVRFGDPIELKDYYSLYKENEPKAMKQLMQDLAGRIKPLMLNINSDDYYELHNQLRQTFNNDVLEKQGKTAFSRPRQLVAEQQLVDALYEKELEAPDFMQDMQQKADDYFKALRQYKLRDWVVKQQGGRKSAVAFKALMLALLAPVFLYGYVNNFIVYHLTDFLGKQIKDWQFRNSVKFVFYTFVAPLIYLLQLAVVSIWLPNFWWGLGYFISIFITGYWAFSIYMHAKKALGQLRYLFLPTQAKNRLQEMRNSIREGLLGLIK